MQQFGIWGNGIHNTVLPFGWYDVPWDQVTIVLPLLILDQFEQLTDHRCTCTYLSVISIVQRRFSLLMMRTLYSTMKCELPYCTLDADGVTKMIAAVGGWNHETTYCSSFPVHSCRGFRVIALSTAAASTQSICLYSSSPKSTIVFDLFSHGFRTTDRITYRITMRNPSCC